jgi:hypothetical protein
MRAAQTACVLWAECHGSAAHVLRLKPQELYVRMLPIHACQGRTDDTMMGSEELDELSFATNNTSYLMN